MTRSSQSGLTRDIGPILECVVNVSEGRDLAAVGALANAGQPCLLDVHSDGDHNRSVLTLGGAGARVEGAVREVAATAVRLLDIGQHSGAHPRIGIVDVVPWVAIEGWPLRDSSPGQARQRAGAARDRFALWAAGELRLPVFLYGPERSLPELRRKAWRALPPDVGPGRPHPTAGAVAAGWRPLMVAYNLWMAEPDLARARAIATAVRSPVVRSLAFSVHGQVQVSCNLVDPFAFGPADIWDQVSHMAPVARGELVGLVPEGVLRSAPEARWGQLDLAPERTIEARLSRSAA